MAQVNTIVVIAMSVAMTSAIWAGLSVYKSSPSAPVSNPEIVFETPVKPIMECEDAGKVSSNELARCTDKDRDVTCYILGPRGSSTSMSCLPNQWLNYPQSVANVNEPILNEK